MCCILVADIGVKSNEKLDPLFPDLTADGDDSGVSEIESLCLSCYKQVRYVMCISVWTVYLSNRDVRMRWTGSVCKHFAVTDTIFSILSSLQMRTNL